MISLKDATFQKSTILSVNDPRVEKLQHSLGDKFCLRVQSFDKTWCRDIRDLCADKRVIVEIDGFAHTVEGEIAYFAKFLEPSYSWKWLLSNDDLENDWLYLGSDFQEARFVFIAD